MIQLEKWIVLFTMIRNRQQIISEMLRIYSFSSYLWISQIGDSISSKLETMNVYCLHSKYVMLRVKMKLIRNMGLKAFKSVIQNVALREHFFNYFDCGWDVQLYLKHSQGKRMVAIDTLLIVKSNVMHQLSLLPRPAVIFVLLFRPVELLNLPRQTPTEGFNLLILDRLRYIAVHKWEVPMHMHTHRLSSFSRPKHL